MRKRTMILSMVVHGRSRLNPNAPIFIPTAAFAGVEGFWPECWDLVKTSPRSREYWLSQRQEDDFISSGGDRCDYVELEAFSYTDGSRFVESKAPQKQKELPNGLGIESIDVKALLKSLNLELDVSKSSKGRGRKASMGPTKYCEKKTGNVRVSAKCAARRRIHQPR